MSFGRRILLAGVALLGSHGAGVAQDVELLGRLHGKPPPQAYYDLMGRHPDALRFKSALIRRGLGVRRTPPVRAAEAAGSASLPASEARQLAYGERETPLAGSFSLPLVLGLFSDSPAEPPYTRDAVQAEFWDGPQSNPVAVGTIPDFYTEMSGGLVDLSGVTFDWVRTPLTQYAVTANGSGWSQDAALGEFIVRVIEGLDDGTVDWGQFDNDGEDGVPNSGDDDGFVDILTVMHPTPGGECQESGSNRIWSHKWNLVDAAGWYLGDWTAEVRTQGGYVTQTPSNSTGHAFIRINDYTIQPVQNCPGTALNEIGVVAHELGHGFGLRDLYPTGPNHDGIGNWGLMGTGSWGCDGDSPESPCHLSAWSKALLGWVEVITLPSGSDLGTLTLPPVETDRKVYRVDAGDGSGEYFLLEGRGRFGFDAGLLESGLLVWHIDPETIAARWNSNTINNDPDRMGVWLRQADGLNELAWSLTKERGDAGDPFPGSTGNTVFHAGSNPSAWTHAGHAAGVTLLDIGEVEGEVAFRILSRYQTLTLSTQGSPGGMGLVSLDGIQAPSVEWNVPSAPFQSHVLEASAGAEVAAGTRVAFQSWEDGGDRVRTIVTGLEDASFTARYGGTEYLLDISLASPAPGVSPGEIEFSQGDGLGWVPEGSSVLIRAVPRTGFGFSGWTGGLAGQSNPATYLASAPLQAGAAFDLTFSTEANPTTVSVEGASSVQIDLVVENANLPVSWDFGSGALPDGMTLSSQGRILGTPLERGSFPLQLRVTDAIGLQGSLLLDLQVTDPQVSAQEAVAPFLLTGAPLSEGVRTFLDRAGNWNYNYDLGDFRAFILRNQGLSSAQAISSSPSTVVIRIPWARLRPAFVDPGDAAGPRSPPGGHGGEDAPPGKGGGREGQ